MNRMSGETALGLAWIIALVASLAVLFIGEVLGQTPCVLCWFQRAFMFPLAIVLGLGLSWRDYRGDRPHKIANIRDVPAHATMVDVLKLTAVDGK